MITSEKIEEWLEEVKERPESAPLILQYIANRLRDLSERNEELLAENIALLTGKRVEEYESRIAHLEYQLDLLKRQFAGEPSFEFGEGTSQPGAPLAPETFSILVYNAEGRVVRVELQREDFADGSLLGRLRGILASENELPQIRVVPSTEELLYIFTSGRVAAMPAANIPPTQLAEAREGLDWKQAPLPDEPHAGETLAYLTPISKMALAEYFVQVSRRGYVKKIRTAMAQSILDNHYIGAGVKQSADKTLGVILSGKENYLLLVSWEGYLLGLEAGGLPYSIEEAMRLGRTDHLVAAFVPAPGQPVLVMTQIGKVIHLAEDGLEFAATLKLRGRPVFSAQRRKQGVRVVGAASVGEQDWGVALHQDGQITLHAIRQVLGSGAIPSQSELLAFSAFSLPDG